MQICDLVGPWIVYDAPRYHGEVLGLGMQVQLDQSRLDVRAANLVLVHVMIDEVLTSLKLELNQQ